ncbi:PilZ domain-containing protein [Rhodoblastus sp.]|uniref:PilZ domain-containing protein n=1 Tax=Rhodoblastus sp. TaxID=1962975 RepID=UPI00260D0248|nr:PilZ domain-containing protein [Rhodoblastus sp.]
MRFADRLFTPRGKRHAGGGLAMMAVRASDGSRRRQSLGAEIAARGSAVGFDPTRDILQKVFAMFDHRKEHRRRAYLGATITFNERSSVVDCLVRNLSEGGARLEMAHPISLPTEFEVTIPRRGEYWRARQAWRDSLALGVTFVPSDSGTDVSIESARRIKQLQSERDALAKRLAEMSEPAI